MKKFFIPFVAMALLTGCGTADVETATSSPITLNTFTDETDAESTTASTHEAIIEDAPVSTAVSTTADPKIKTTAQKGARTTVAVPTATRAARTTAARPSGGVPVTAPATAPRTAAQTDQPKTTASTSVTTTVTTTADDNSYPLNKGYEPEIKENGIDIIFGGEVLQTLEADTAALLEHKDDTDKASFSIVKADFDFDKYEDIYIPESFGDVNSSGKYFRFDPEQKKYVEWEEMNKLIYSASVNASNNTVIVRTNSETVMYEDKFYSWENDTLVLVQRIVQYTGEDGEIYCDHFTVNNGSESLTQRDHIFKDENGNTVSEIVPPTEPTAPSENSEE